MKVRTLYKALIALSVAMIAFGVWLGVSLQECLTPVTGYANIKPIADSVISFKDLPDHYFYSSARKSGWGAKAIHLYSNKDKQTVYILSSWKLNPFSSAQDIVNDAADKGAPGLISNYLKPFSNYGKMKVQNTGRLTAGGQKLFYATGMSQTDSCYCSYFPCAIACTTKSGRFYLLLIGQESFAPQEPERKLDLKTVKKFFACIKEFR